MNAELLRRVVRAIATGSLEDLDHLARRIIEQERKSGHAKVAADLDAILRRAKRPTRQTTTIVDQDRGLSELPQARRHHGSLVSLVPKEHLEHHMVLPLETEARFARIEKEYAARERLGAFGLKHRRTVLLYGPPGCGKSLGAKRLAWNTGLPLMKVRFDALLSSYFGESLSNLRAVFDSVKERPSVLLLDECDFIARSRSGSKDVGEASRVVNMLLQLMEEFDGPGLLVATTNVAGALDEALFRRFDDVFQVPMPGPDEIEQLLKLALSGVIVATGIPWHSVVKSLLGQPAAQVVRVAQEAAKTAVLNGDRVVDEKRLLLASGELHRQGSSAVH